MRRLAGLLVLSCLGLACKPSSSGSVAPDPGVEPSGIGVVVEAPPRPQACTARTSRGALGLVPATSDWILHLSPRVVLGTMLWSMLAPAFAQDADWIEFDGAFTSCGLALASIEHVVVGIHGDDAMAILAAPGVAQPEVARCLIDALLADNAESQRRVELVAWAEDPSVTLIEYETGRAYLFDTDMMVITTAAWSQSVGELSRCEGEGAIAGEDRELLGRIDINAPIWLVGRFTPGIGREFEDAFGLDPGSIRDVALSMRFDGGVELIALARMYEERLAFSFANSLRSMLAMFGSMLGTEVAHALERFSVESLDKEVTVSGSLTAEELQKIR